jgi:hypothetical protein
MRERACRASHSPVLVLCAHSRAGRSHHPITHLKNMNKATDLLLVITVFAAGPGSASADDASRERIEFLL